MLLKGPDDKTHRLTESDRLAKAVPTPRKRQIAEESWILRAGIKGEQEAAYLLDFRMKGSRNPAIIHDLRLDVNGRVTQIDHLLLHRTLTVFVLETKHCNAELKISEKATVSLSGMSKDKHVRPGAPPILSPLRLTLAADTQDTDRRPGTRTGEPWQPEGEPVRAGSRTGGGDASCGAPQQHVPVTTFR